MHHQRRRSGHGLPANNSTTDVRKCVTASDPSKHKRPVMTRQKTPVNAQKLGRSQREREKAWHEAMEDERESFPQYWYVMASRSCSFLSHMGGRQVANYSSASMTCEKQLVPQEVTGLYCSESCRRGDQASSSSGLSLRHYSGSNYSFSATASASEPRDIIPRASPSRPNSMLFGSSPPATPGSSAGPYASNSNYHTSALAALRSLSMRPPSPPSPTASGGSGSIWPFSRSAANSPASSYSRPSAAPFFSATYDGAYSAYDLGHASADRPLPSRKPSGTTSRPKSIELVTPMVSR